ncbi:MAG: NAD(P)H-quinone oxidoreductase [Pseudomonadota bacterium]
MNVVEITAFGAPEVLRLAQRDRPVPAEGELLIEVAASGVNRPDVLQRKGHYAPPPGASEILGLEVAGRVVGGSTETLAAGGWQLGDRVCALLNGGGYAQYCVAPVGQCLPVPGELTDVQAACLPETVFTVWSNVFERGRLMPGESLLVQGGSSGIGVMAIQMAKAHGAQVLVTVGSTEKAAACLTLGADHAINYKLHNFAAEVWRITHERGVDVILDMVAGDYVARELPCLADDGRLVIIAVQGGTRAALDAGAVLRRRLTITGSTLRARSVAFKTRLARAVRATVWPWIEAGRVKPVLYQSFEAAQAAQAHALMESNRHIGKLVLTW